MIFQEHSGYAECLAENRLEFPKASKMSLDDSTFYNSLYSLGCTFKRCSMPLSQCCQLWKIFSKKHQKWIVTARDVSGQKFLTHGSGRVIHGPFGSGRVGSSKSAPSIFSGRVRVKYFAYLLRVGSNSGWVTISILKKPFLKHFSHFEIGQI